MTFDNRVALVTGGSTGIGAATVKSLAENGVKIAINYFQSEKQVMKVAESARALGGETLLVRADVRDKTQVEIMISRTIKEFGKIDILVNNAGGLPNRLPMLEMNDLLYDEIMSLNVHSVYHCSRAVIPHMAKLTYGRIVNVSSIAAFTGGGRNATIYAASKAWVNGFTKGLAKELGQFGITVNSVAPGFIDTLFHVKAKTGEYAPFLPLIPLKRVGTAEEVADLITYLASDNSSFVTGSVFHVNGGQY
jgi:3-oxoacyl-[acyl-carrier protein] reductase